MNNESCINVFARWDDEAKVYYAWSKDVLGLAIEADTLENLKNRLRDTIPELIALNDHTPYDSHKEVPLCLLTEDNFTAQRQA